MDYLLVAVVQDHLGAVEARGNRLPDPSLGRRVGGPATANEAVAADHRGAEQPEAALSERQRPQPWLFLFEAPRRDHSRGVAGALLVHVSEPLPELAQQVGTIPEMPGSEESPLTNLIRFSTEPFWWAQ